MTISERSSVALYPRAPQRTVSSCSSGTNHVGHFALTGLLLNRMLPVQDSRVVTVSSLGHRVRPIIDFDDLQSERSYDRVAAYTRSKLATLLFTYALQRRLAARGHRRSPWPRIPAVPEPSWRATRRLR